MPPVPPPVPTSMHMYFSLNKMNLSLSFYGASFKPFKLSFMYQELYLQCSSGMVPKYLKINTVQYLHCILLINGYWCSYLTVR